MGRLAAIAIRPKRKAPLQELEGVEITRDGGLAGDHAGRDLDRLVTVMTREAWQAALAELGLPADGEDALPWTTRRANLLTDGVALPRAAGGVIAIGEVELEVTDQTWPCRRMEEAQPGLLKALAKDWRGGVTCRVRAPGRVAVDDAVRVLVSPPEVVRRLP